MIYTFQEQETPQGDNKQGALDSYDNSLYYDIIFPQTRQQAQPIVLRANIRGIYGKVNQSGFAIVPKDKYISQIDAEGTHMALSIVKECFDEMAEYYSKLDARNKLNPNSSSYKELKPSKSWSDYKLSFDNYRNLMLDDFINSKDTDTSEIKDYLSFEGSFLKYCTAQKRPLTMSGYVVSKNSSPFGTGLVIDLADEDVGDDAIKYENFIKDPNFNVFRKVVNRFGFRFDGHIPWRIYFDVSHPYSVKKMEKYGVKNLKEFFEKYYDRIIDVLPNDLDSFMHGAYNTFYTIDSTYMQTRPCAQGTRTKIEIKERESVSLEKIRKKYNKEHWLRMYVYFRAVETRKKWIQSKFDRVVKEASQMRKHRGQKHMYSYLESYFNNKTAELFSERPLTDKNYFDRIVTRFKF